MPRQNIYFTEDTLTKLKKFLKEKHGKHRALSITVEQAVEEFLRRQPTPLPVTAPEKFKGQV